MTIFFMECLKKIEIALPIHAVRIPFKADRLEFDDTVLGKFSFRESTSLDANPNGQFLVGFVCYWNTAMAISFMEHS